MTKTVKIKKGLDIKLKGKSRKDIGDIAVKSGDLYAIKPIDFAGVIPKLLVKEEESVKKGTPLFYSKSNPEIVFCSPVSGSVKAVVRGEKRLLLEVVIEADGAQESVDLENIGDAMKKEEFKNLLLKYGFWPAIRQRPFNIIAHPEDSPKAIFISGFDSAPLAPDFEYVFKNRIELIQKAIDSIAMLTDGKVYLSLHKKHNGENSIFKTLKNVEINYFEGPHPSGNIGTQIHHLDPINIGETAWFISLFDLLNIGRLLEEKKLSYDKVITLSGAEFKDPKYYNACSGVSLWSIEQFENAQSVRTISGNVLSGRQISDKGFLGFYDYSFTAIPEGDYYEFMGWIMPGFKKFSVSRTFFSWLTPKREYNLDTNMHGELRNFVVTGQYEKVFPWDIMPQQLIKAMMVRDYDMMQNLGILEVAEEDFALCEVICTSKNELQDIVRNSITDYIKEMV
ncbi:MAG: Na(+)-translocating NADH-quinone reductase subunit A [Bacteroidales bacterium]|jgi:Na+-transporting NADH:ubiquinone oxidoreductase subunit A